MSFIFEGHLVQHTGQMSDKIIQSHGHRAMLNIRFLSHEHRIGGSGTMGSLEKRAGRVLSTRPGQPTNNGSLTPMAGEEEALCNLSLPFWVSST